MAQEPQFRPDTTNVCLIKQGAEAKIYTCTYQGKPTIVKERFSKLYRHPVLDRTLTVRRSRAEVKCIQRCRNMGIRCPEIYFVDSKTNMIYMEHIVDSISVKDYLTQQLSGSSGSSPADTTAATKDCSDNALDTAAGGIPNCDASGADGISAALLKLAKEIGRILGTMHGNHTIHGDLTTSNLLLEGRPEDHRIAVIDFGLGSYDESAEDKGVDLYVLERALLSTHPKTEKFFEAILEGYKNAFEQVDNDRGAASDRKRGKRPSAEQVLKKLDEVRMRGRKRTMVG